MLCRILNGICCLLYSGEYRRFTAPCNVGKVQERYLRELLRKNADTVYGRKYGFGSIGSYDDFAAAVPLTVYEDYEPYISAMAQGEDNVLTAERIKLFELTSGSSGGKKMIPYTAA
ncbi:MAG: GH3 auxin-responsive promoter family protein, partial [Oscillospiraceae bacterium]|nr:GH3 auxin-responsive promoter family protein [Oscillospiraceae bacterium]